MTKGELNKLIRQSNSKYDAVRQRVAGNPNCPVEILVGLIGDEESTVHKEAVKAFRSRKKKATPEERDFIKDYEALVKLGLI